MNVEWLDPKLLKPDPKNPNHHSDEQIERLARLIQYQGWRLPIIVSKQDDMIKGFEIRDVINHLFGSGFPKSLDISKAIDKAAGAEREVVGESGKCGMKTAASGYQDNEKWSGKILGCAVTSEAKQWEGYGTALKPACENWILIRKPCTENTVADNVLKYGTGGLNIDASRIGNGGHHGGITGAGNSSSYDLGKSYIPGPHKIYNQGRWPANLILSHNPDCIEVGTKQIKSGDPNRFSKTDGGSFVADFNTPPISNLGNEDGTETVAAWECSEGCAVKLLDEQSGVTKSAGGHTQVFTSKNGIYGKYGEKIRANAGGLGDIGGASRFFYCAKPSNSEKNEGCDSLPQVECGIGDERPSGQSMSRLDGRPPRKTNNIHPTVKPIRLMSYLIKLITPPGGIVLDPFCGSGTTLVTCEKYGFTCYASELNPEYCDIIIARWEGLSKTNAEKIEEPYNYLGAIEWQDLN